MLIRNLETLTSLQLTERTTETYCSLHVVVQGPGSFPPWSVFRKYGFKAMGCRSSLIFAFLPIFPIQN